MSQINSECLFFDDTDDETEVNSLLSGFSIDAALVIQASTPTIQKYQRSHMVRDRYDAHDRLVLAYFAKKPFYNAYLFRKRFRMKRSLFTRIVRDLSANCPYFQEGCDAVGKARISALVKCTSAIRQLAYAAVLDSQDEYLQIGEKLLVMLFTRIVRDFSANCPYFQEGCDAVGKAGISALVKCTSAIRQLAYAAVPDSLNEYLQIGEKTSRDCLMHFCNGVIELYARSICEGPRKLTSKNSTLFTRTNMGFLVLFVANDVTYKWGYYLTDGIYPEWAVLMKSISQPGSNDVKQIRYKQAHEATRKHVERTFGVLKKKWVIVRTPAWSRSLKRIMHLMYTCIILHNMIRKEKGNAISPNFYPKEQHREDDPVRSAQDRLRVIREIHDEETHLNLKADLVEHI
ncbi:protein translocase subunit SecA2, chloroplastic isoform X1 [Tanacetum coccineum]